MLKKNVLKCTIQSLTFQCKKNEDEDTKMDDTRVVTSQDIYIFIGQSYESRISILDEVKQYIGQYMTYMAISANTGSTDNSLIT